jgi:hypothetical protein
MMRTVPLSQLPLGLTFHPTCEADPFRSGSAATDSMASSKRDLKLIVLPTILLPTCSERYFRSAFLGEKSRRNAAAGACCTSASLPLSCCARSLFLCCADFQPVWGGLHDDTLRGLLSGSLMC